MIFNFVDYKAFLRAHLKTKPKGGYGFLSKLALGIHITSAQMSHVMRGGRDLSPEQALKAARQLGLTAPETNYFLEMVNYARAGSKELRDFSEQRLTLLKAEGLQVKNQVPTHQVLSDREKADFYSSWIYSAIRLYCSRVLEFYTLPN